MSILLETSFEIDWKAITPDVIREQIPQAIAKAQNILDGIVALSEGELTMDNTYNAFENASYIVGENWGKVCHLDSVANNDELRKVKNELLPKVTDFNTGIFLRTDVLEKLQAFRDAPAFERLDDLHKRFVTETLLDFETHGAFLKGEAREEYARISKEIAQLAQAYGEHVLDSTKAHVLVIRDLAQLAGVPATAVENARAEAERAGVAMPAWQFNTKYSSSLPLLRHCSVPDTRRRMHELRYRIGTGQHDNEPIIWKMAQLRSRKAALLGHATWADLTLARRMARTGAAAKSFLDGLHDKVETAWRRDLERLAARKGAPLDPWDTSFYSEKLRQEELAFDSERVRPYLPLEEVLRGFLEVTQRLFGVAIEQAEPPSPVWHEEVTYWRVTDQAGELRGAFYMDLFPRDNKRGGAWCNDMHSGADGAPHLGLICANLTRAGSGPALLSFEDLTTLYHEGGHLLHHILSRVPVRSLSGLTTPWDYVETPSQLMENFCYEPEVLRLFARHHETGEVISDELVQGLRKSRRFLSGLPFMRQLSLGRMDLELHHVRRDLEAQPIDAVLQGVLTGWRHFEDQPTIIRSFSHLFGSSSGYSASYYSYMWAATLEADAFSRFVDAGTGRVRYEVGQEFLQATLSRGNSIPVEQQFRDFMGRDPDTDALLRREGLM
eukprot:gnl/Dysnectes_brevis/1194_a1335_1425.p1 GENE.gnl/Dysnectes_brevis/1194_a1335_1425~~gnl/Dysnectes_brevis/1194_a1335_1425.p1  ORF type:complete len:667 (+),score=280.43 gnl/Dysnectes_brevis/1194_a1335_1425:830-2830(+)